MIKWTLFLLLVASSCAYSQTRIFLSPTGNDAQAGTLTAPIATLEKALEKAKAAPQNEVEVLLRKGVYYLPQTLRINPQRIGKKKLLISAYNGESVELNGGRRLQLNWQKTGERIWTAHLTGESFEQLFINGKKQVLARYPNYDSTAHVFNGTAADATSDERVGRWRNPAGGYIHALHAHEWGGFHYRITGKNDGKLTYEGGWQNNRPMGMHPKERFVENIIEELDAPGEWFFDKITQTLSFMPPAGVDLATAVVEVSRLKSLIELTGKPEAPLRQVQIRGIRLANAERTFMEPYEPLLRSDWMLYRGAAVYLENTENCRIEDCELTNLGGNALLVSRYNRIVSVKGCHIHHVGATAIGFVGDTSAVRSPEFRYEWFVPYAQLDLKPGPKNNRYPAQCIAEDNLVHNIGEIEKQATGVELSMASDITVRHNTIYHVPRAGINIGDGTWGGHLLEFNDVFETVLETGDHGSFNSWGRDRFWHSNRKTMDSLVAAHPELIKLDALKPVIIRNNRFRCDHGWDIDLDDGSSNYLIYNNVLLNGGLKFREGFYRTAENNVIVNNSFHPHVWFKNSGDVFRRNIVMRPYFPIQINYWGKELDNNLFPDQDALHKAQQNHTDEHSRFGDPHFLNPEHGDYRVSKDSPALAVGFQNFSMHQFGVQKPALRALARSPKLPALLNAQQEKNVTEMTWLGVTIRNVQGLGDRSAFGLPDENGIVVLMVPKENRLAAAGLQKGDVIRTANGTDVATIRQLVDLQQQLHFMKTLPIRVMRNQQTIDLNLPMR
ncbi:PDZ domain-containing protein [Spirosoma validum]|uniref:Right-handed parallel beta-helix repeat-containing protein n=1 Tax=Spirosoma validum TaxID=2771355 RepID=A0A927B563_9BACT|nr:PDZ domain-containing protein [Spirosoma validum]MBD2755854.1 right-handed parallel beta-helix repeat-containing protein [Spirosoma validum]